ncbi:Ig domain-containing protein [Myxococcus sp. SDU36]|uniref:Ig domain-containing protein n=1 Tax=Myxococcus sp. SDU36 TaxID=2831967 RepID=UPI0025428681|nr:Ig domain-containing protein [Myxococcus sp. SDU36]WIG95719.1 Ig domain-containing protein [Myxococcus sp. SDU36]
MRRALAPLLALLLGAACSFSPDLSRFPPCEEAGVCPAGWTCLASEAHCVPDCGAQGACPAPVGDAGTALSLDPDSLPVGLEGTAYSGTLKARGGTPPYSFTATSTLPAGLTLNPEGVLSGTPAMDGEFFLAIRVKDQSAAQASGSIPLRINQKLRLAGPGVLADAAIDSAYVERISATGGQEPYRFSLATGSALPPGLSLASNGEVMGSASGQPAVTRFTVQVTDSGSPSQESTRELALETVAPELLGVRIMTRSMPDARSGTRYSYTLRSYNGTQWSLNGALPPGLMFHETEGVISGTPQAPPEPRRYSFYIIRSNGPAGSVDREVSIRVDEGP